MRPRLPRSKRPSMQSLFAPANFFSVIGQVLIHLLSTEVGILFARQVEKQINSVENAATLRVRAANAQTPRMAALTNALVKSLSGDSDEAQMPRFLRRPKFVPNYETNVVCKCAADRACFSYCTTFLEADTPLLSIVPFYSYPLSFAEHRYHLAVAQGSSFLPQSFGESSS
jgi:hypothetical protein